MNNNIELIVRKIKDTSSEPLRNQFIKDYQPFILSEISKKLKRYISSTSDEAFIVGLMAFNEAIDRYEADRGKFLSYASLVINSRILDYIKREQSYQHNVVLDEVALLNEAVSVDEDLRDDLTIFTDRLNSFGIDIESLVDKAPKHHNTRVEVTRLGRTFSMDEAVVEYLYQKLRLPIKRVVLKYQCSRRTVERFKYYIIAVMVVITEQLESISSFLIIGGE